MSLTQRSHAEDYWGNLGQARSQSGNTNGGLGSKLEGFMEKKELPMYKDKPYNYAGSRKYIPLYRQKSLISGAVLAVIGLAYWFGIFSSSVVKSKPGDTSKSAWSWLNSPATSALVDWDDRREKVKEAFMLSWDGYEQYAWGFDEYHPISKTGKQMDTNGKGMGWIIVDALDTLMIMNLTSRLSHAREWISTSLDYNQDHEVNTFETTIRMLGGLLSAYYLSTAFPDMAPLADDDQGAPGEDLYLEKAADLAGRLIGAFDSDSGVPYASVNLKTSKGKESHVDGGASSTAEASSLQLEFKYLAMLTGEKNYWESAEKVIQVIDDNGMEDGLLPIFIYATTGTFRDNNIRLGSRGDSYYEYLIKQFLQTSCEEPIYQEMWNQSLAGVKKWLITYSTPNHFTVLGERPFGLGSKVEGKMDHLVCFMPGTVALGITGGLTVEEVKKAGLWSEKEEEDMALAIELTKTCWGMYQITPTGLAPEIAHFQLGEHPHMESDGILASKEMTRGAHAAWKDDYIIKVNDRHNLQRPETVESLFYMWRITGDERYREWGWEMFTSFVKYSAAADGAGFTSLANANDIPPLLKDNMESFWLAETLKYFYLLFSPNDLLPLESIVINTEAHIFPRFKLTRGLKTGWERKQRDEQGRIVQPARSDVKEDRKGHQDSNPSTDAQILKVEETTQAPLVEATSP